MGCCFSTGVIPDVDGFLQDGVGLLQQKSEVKAAADVITKSFAGSSGTAPELTFDWCMGDDLKEKWDDPRRHESVDWMSRYMIFEGLAMGKKGAVLVSRDDNGMVVGVAVIKIYRSKVADGVCVPITAFCNTGNPSSVAGKYLSCSRMNGLVAAMKRLHNAHAKGPHLYVWAIAVDPGAQGQGVGGKLMRSAMAIADHEGLPSYLECSGSRNPKIYERYGFATVGQEEIRTKATKGAAEEVCPEPFYGMVRPPNK